MNIINRILGYLGGVLLYIFLFLKDEYLKLRFVGKGIPRHEKITDIVEVFRPTIFFFLFNLLALLFFLLLPQGKDVILIVAEDLRSFRPGPMFSLFAGLVVWSVVAEFGVRYKLYITDNSAFALTSERVEYRKQLQAFFSISYLILPFIIILISFSFVFFTTTRFDEIKKFEINWPFIVIFVITILLTQFLVRFYLDRKWIIGRFQKTYPELAKFFKLNHIEDQWSKKLFGIYNDYVFLVRKENVYIDRDWDNVRTSYEKFIASIKPFMNGKRPPDENGNQFPQDFVVKSEIPPQGFNKGDIEFKKSEFTYVLSEELTDDERKHPDSILVLNKKPFQQENKLYFKRKENENGYYRWVFKLNPAFYKTLHKQVGVIALGSLVTIILISFGFILSPEWIGSPGLVCLSFACWQGIYAGLLFLDARYKRNVPISFRWLLVAWVLIVSYMNIDHPVRTTGSYETSRTPMLSHFQQWADNHSNSKKTATVSTSPYYDTAHPKGRTPVIFITAEGGALRTGAFTAMLMAALQDAFPDFKNHIYAYSSVSGGTVGVGFFHSIAYLDTASRPINFREVTRKFFLKDQLSPVLSKFFFADLLNNLWPVQFERFDRAVALEKAWENSYESIFTKTNTLNPFGRVFLSPENAAPTTPAWFINTTEVESGLQCYLSNVVPVTKGDAFLLNDERDIFSKKLPRNINYSTAMSLSARFPLVSPSAAVALNDKRVFHYVDGGYAENTGSKTMLEILTLLKDSLKNKGFIPYLLHLRFGEDGNFQSTSFLNEINSIAQGMYNVRSGYSRIYSESLRKMVEDTLKGCFINIPLPVNAADVPMSWVLSDRSMANLEKVIDQILAKGENGAPGKHPMHKLFLFEK